MKTDHSKIENYLINNCERLFPFKIIGKEKLCYMNKKNNGQVEVLKLDLLGADEKLFYLIEIKTGVVTSQHINKYIKCFSNFKCLNKGIKIVFVAKEISKNARELIKECICNIEIIYFDELDNINSLKIDKSKKIKPTYALDEYRISFLLKMYFSDINNWHMLDLEQWSQINEDFHTIRYSFMNNYIVKMYINRDNYIYLDVAYTDKIYNTRYPYVEMYNMRYVEPQLVYISKIVETISFLEDKILSYKEYIELTKSIIYKVDTKTNKKYKPPSKYLGFK
ncbi:endonuclease NucS [Clostridium lacusfryxellense]|uniref:endonuclease NucS n=1 Tax=Clostridium lacusfryxellense TaxID=205328 RepID=UPI001C0C5316|nr:endonuclease NucS [Clostridium lacusfryxellense]MBU3114341.1 DUF91 domain-containing protein [Clostridium lacusfryxellense]